MKPIIYSLISASCLVIAILNVHLQDLVPTYYSRKKAKNKLRWFFYTWIPPFGMVLYFKYQWYRIQENRKLNQNIESKYKKYWAAAKNQTSHDRNMVNFMGKKIQVDDIEHEMCEN